MLLSLAPLGFFWNSCCCGGDPEYWVSCGINSAGSGISTHAGYIPNGDSWTIQDDVPSPARSQVAGGSISALAHVTGGFTTGGVSDNDQFDTAGASWSSKTSLLAARYQHSGSAYDGGVYVTAGRLTGGTLTRNHEAYDVSGDSWSTLDVTPSPARAMATIAEALGFLYLMGGLNSLGSALLDNDEYDFPGDSWSSVANLPSPARWGIYGGCSILDLVYLQGGDGTGVFTDLDRYDPSGDSWTSLTSGRSHVWHVIKETGGLLYATAGGTNTGLANIITNHDSYDPDTDSWDTLQPIGTGTFHSAVNSLG